MRCIYDIICFLYEAILPHVMLVIIQKRNLRQQQNKNRKKANVNVSRGEKKNEEITFGTYYDRS